jgi:hypothetical protein
LRRNTQDTETFRKHNRKHCPKYRAQHCAQLMDLILYSKPGCHLCEGMIEKLQAIDAFPIALEIRNIETNDDWLARYQYEIPVLVWRRSSGQETPIPRPSPRVNAAQLTQLLQRHLESED